jgi:hypothetical protein
MMFRPLYGLDAQEFDDRELWLWRIPGVEQVCNFVWDTRVPEVTDPGPGVEPMDIGDALALLSPQTTSVLTTDTIIMEAIRD